MRFWDYLLWLRVAFWGVGRRWMRVEVVWMDGTIQRLSGPPCEVRRQAFALARRKP